MSHIKTLKGKTALVTGASRGIGAAIAKVLAQNGAYVYINYHTDLPDAAAEKKLLFSICGEQGNGELIQASVSQETDVKSLFEKIKKNHSKLDILVNNAGITQDRLLGLMSLQDWQKVIETNLTGVYLCCHQAVKIFLAQKAGKIINISSVSGLLGTPGQTNYAAAKAGIIAFTKSLACEVGRYNIQVNAVAPGYIDTDMLKKLSPVMRAAIAAKCVVGRLGRPEEIAHIVNFLVSDQSSYIHGQTIIADGGLL